MKRILFFLLLVPCFLHAQDDTIKYLKYPTSYGVQYPRIWANKVLRTPFTDTSKLNALPGAIQAGLDGYPYWWNGLKWNRLSNTGDLADYVPFSDSLSTFVTPAQLSTYYDLQKVLSNGNIYRGTPAYIRMGDKNIFRTSDSSFIGSDAAWLYAHDNALTLNAERLNITGSGISFGNFYDWIISGTVEYNDPITFHNGYVTTHTYYQNGEGTSQLKLKYDASATGNPIVTLPYNGNATETVAYQNWVTANAVPYNGATGNVNSLFDITGHELHGTSKVSTGDDNYNSSFDGHLFEFSGFSSPGYVIQHSGSNPTMFMDNTQGIQFYGGVRLRAFPNTGESVLTTDASGNIKLVLPASVLFVSDISALLAYTGNATALYVLDTLRGGIFNRVSTGLANDYGIYFPATGGGYWQRNIANASALNIRWWGALGNGVSSLYQDTFALHHAFAYIRSSESKCGRLYSPNPPVFYAFAGNSVYTIGMNGLEMFGDGKGLSEWRDIQPTTQIAWPGCIISVSNYSGRDSVSYFQPGVQMFAVNSGAKYGDTILVLNDVTKADSMFVGEVVAYGAHATLAGTLKTRFRQGEANQITKIAHDTIYFKYPFTIDSLTTFSGIPPEIVNLNNNAPIAGKDTTVTRFLSKNIYVHDMSLTQASRDEKADTAISLSSIGSVLQNFQAFNSSVYNCYLVSSYGFSGGLISHTSFYNNTILWNRSATDNGYNSTMVDYINNTFIYNASAPKTAIAQSSIIGVDDAHWITYSGNSFTGSLDTGQILNFNGAHHMTVVNNNFYYPNYKQDADLFSISNDSLASTNYLIFTGNTVTTDSAGTFMDFTSGIGVNSDTDNHNYIANNVINSHRKVNTSSTVTIRIIRMNGVTMANNVVPVGVFSFQNASKLKVSGFNNPASPATFTSLTNSTFDNNVFLSATGTVPTNSSNTIAGVLTTGRLAVDAYPANSFYGNNTSSTATPTAIVYKSVAEQSYIGTPTWTGTSPPSGTATNNYEWQQVGKVVTVTLKLQYSVAGSAVTAVSIPFPTDLPAVYIPTGLSGSSDNYTVGNIGVYAGTAGANIGATPMLRIRGDGAGGVNMMVTHSSGAPLIYQLVFTYFTN